MTNTIPQQRLVRIVEDNNLYYDDPRPPSFRSRRITLYKEEMDDQQKTQVKESLVALCGVMNLQGDAVSFLESLVSSAHRRHTQPLDQLDAHGIRTFFGEYHNRAPRDGSMTVPHFATIARGLEDFPEDTLVLMEATISDIWREMIPAAAAPVPSPDQGYDGGSSASSDNNSPDRRSAGRRNNGGGRRRATFAVPSIHHPDSSDQTDAMSSS